MLTFTRICISSRVQTSTTIAGRLRLRLSGCPSANRRGSPSSVITGGRFFVLLTAFPANGLVGFVLLMRRWQVFSKLVEVIRMNTHEYTWKMGLEYCSRTKLRTNRPLAENVVLTDLYNGQRYLVQAIYPRIPGTGNGTSCRTPSCILGPSGRHSPKTNCSNCARERITLHRSSVARNWT